MASQVRKTRQKADSVSRHEPKFITQKGRFMFKCGGTREKKYEKPKPFSTRRKNCNRRGTGMKIKVHYLGLVKTYTNKTQDDAMLPENAKLSDLLNKMATEFGKQFKADIYEPGDKDLKTMFTVMVNGVVSGQLDGLDTKMKEGDSVILMPLMTGG
jgi:molybdopterin synthase sulfur carrier subunit